MAHAPPLSPAPRRVPDEQPRHGLKIVIDRLSAPFKPGTDASVLERVLAIVAALVTLSASAVGVVHSCRREPLSLRGIVTDESFYPVQGAVVTAPPGTETLTGPDGTFAFRVPELRRGDEIRLSAQREGYRPGGALVAVGSDELSRIVLGRLPNGGGGEGGDGGVGAGDVRLPTVIICGWDAGVETITLCNRAGAPVPIGRWTLSDGEGDYQIPPDTVLAVDARWTVGIDDYNPTRFSGYLMLNNTRDEILLHDQNRDLVHEVSWTRGADAVRVPVP